MAGIRLQAVFKPQSIGSTNYVSLFNNRTKAYKEPRDTNSEESEEMQEVRRAFDL